MSVVDTQFRTITCNGKGCDKSVTFQVFQQGIEKTVVDANPWIRTHRAIQTSDGRVFSYCGDICNVSGIESGDLNAPEPKSIIDTSTAPDAAVQAAAAAAKRSERATAALKEGKGITVTGGQ